MSGIKLFCVAGDFMIRIFSLSAAFLIALSAPAHALTKVKVPTTRDAGNNAPPLSQGETLIRTENGRSFSLTGERKDTVIEYRAPIGGRLSAGFSMTYSYDANEAAKAQDSSAMFHIRLKF